MASDTVEMQLQDIRGQLDIQAEAISKLAEVVSALEGVDAALLGSYVMRLKRLHVPSIQAPTAFAPDGGSAPSEPDAAPAVPH